MILVDTSIWVDHFRRADRRLAELLGDDGAWTHPVVIEELAIGQIACRSEVLDALAALQHGPTVGHDAVMALIDARGMSGRGLGVVDVHLLGSVLVVPGLRLWTRDKRLRTVADELGVAAVFS